jgi:hypothetical protein
VQPSNRLRNGEIINKRFLHFSIVAGYGLEEILKRRGNWLQYDQGGVGDFYTVDISLAVGIKVSDSESVAMRTLVWALKTT